MNRKKIIQKLIEKHGHAKIAAIAQKLTEGSSASIIAEELSISRERARMLFPAFGERLTIFLLHPEVQKVLDQKGRDDQRQRSPDPDL